jgi:hypothetical protein
LLDVESSAKQRTPALMAAVTSKFTVSPLATAPIVAMAAGSYGGFGWVFQSSVFSSQSQPLVCSVPPTLLLDALLVPTWSRRVAVWIGTAGPSMRTRR